MKPITTSILLLLAVCGGPAHASGNDREAAVAMVEKGGVFLKKHGRDALIKAVNERSPEFIVDGLYLGVRGMDGVTRAHATNPKLVGKNMAVLPDADGKLFRQQIIDIAKTKGSGWMDYRYNNPATGVIEKKTTYFVRHGDVILEAGIYLGK
ncbi:cache domain-containing protein [Massilia glaciei]|uniref:Cache type 2 domain-containing protein n=1 Tax=Massilia glaciei TaxID=1524097 RepID=A0A2U2I7M9_9BURK|nr:cache domain-containing protein [Massilia glaciei]PWF55740.1 cache type 2 domain-containing protein [Massilia glaciei]